MVHEINKAMQHSKVNKHFITLINYINEKGYYSNGEVMAYLYGQICHFALDSTVHPFVIYNVGRYDEKKKETYKYNGLHEEMEYYIDNYLIFKRENVLPKDYKVYKEIFKFGKFNRHLCETIDNVMKEVYGFDNVSSIYYKSLTDMKKFFHVFNYDKWGVKKEVYKIMDKIAKGRVVRKEELSFNIDPMGKLFYLNEEKATWNHPCDKDEKFDLSFHELYELAIDKAVLIINAVDKMLRLEKIDEKKLAELLGNLDYGTGKDCDLKREYKYFKF